jgi:hypothetical protein
VVRQTLQPDALTIKEDGSMRGHYMLPALSALVIVGCDGGVATGPDDPSAARAENVGSGGANPLDVSGEWVTSGEYVIHLNGEAAAFFGVQQEGPRTHLSCEFTGTFSVVQTGSTFGGSYTEAGHCETAGGLTTQVNVGGEIVGGTVRGHSIHYALLEIGGVPVECPQQGAIVEIEGGIAQRLQGSGRCIEPGHPHAILDVPPPRSGPNRQLWEAARP